MSTYMLFTSQIILLVIGFAAGYWFLVTANSREGDLKNIGEILGWTIIAATIILAIFNFIYSMATAMNYCGRKYCPVSSISEPKEDITNIEQQGEPPEPASGDENKPIKRDIKDHE